MPPRHQVGPGMFVDGGTQHTMDFLGASLLELVVLSIFLFLGLLYGVWYERLGFCTVTKMFMYLVAPDGSNKEVGFCQRKKMKRRRRRKKPLWHYHRLSLPGLGANFRCIAAGSDKNVVDSDAVCWAHSIIFAGHELKISVDAITCTHLRWSNLVWSM